MILEGKERSALARENFGSTYLHLPISFNSTLTLHFFILMVDLKAW
jgi:hypothetical protein